MEELIPRRLWALRQFFYLSVLLAVVVWSVFVMFSPPAMPAAPAQTASAARAASSGQDQNLSIRCREWLRYRDRACQLSKRGDAQGAARAREMMNQYHKDLLRSFFAREFTWTINGLEPK